MERNNNRNQNTSRIPENDPSKAMDSKKEVEQSNDEKTDQDFPGYPHYPAKEDIMDQRTGSERVDLNVDEYASGPNSSDVNKQFIAEHDRTHHQDPFTSGENPDKGSSKRRTASEGMNDDDLIALDSTQDEIGTPQNVSNEDLDSGLDLPDSDKEGEDYDSLGRDQD